jgi:transposase
VVGPKPAATAFGAKQSRRHGRPAHVVDRGRTGDRHRPVVWDVTRKLTSETAGGVESIGRSGELGSSRTPELSLSWESSGFHLCFRCSSRLSRKWGSVRAGQWNAGVARNFIEGRREQGFLLPPDVREWLPADHLAWFVIDAVAGMELSAFYAAYRADGDGRAAYEPSLMVALVLFAFATRQRSSRAIERHCRQDVAYRVITGNLVPDHATIARFICRHEQALADLFGEVLRLCDRAGLVKPGVVSIDGTRIAGSASPEVNHSFDQIAREILAEARATDEAEDDLYGEERGDELPEELRTAEGRREFFRRARQEKDESEDCELAVVPEHVVHPVLLGGWWLLKPQSQGVPDEVAR